MSLDRTIIVQYQIEKFRKKLPTRSSVCRFNAAYVVSSPSSALAGTALLEMSGSNLNWANSCNGDNHDGVSLAMFGAIRGNRYAWSVLATWSSAQADRTAILTIVCAFVLRPRRSPTVVSLLSPAMPLSFVGNSSYEVTYYSSFPKRKPRASKFFPCGQHRSPVLSK